MKRRALTKLRQEDDDSECWWDVFIEEILPRLPAKQLQTLKIVCKNWNRIISSPTFVGHHLNVYNQSRIRVVIPLSYELMIEYNKYKINSCHEESNALIRTSTAIRRKICKVLGTCDGLLCLFLVDYYYYDYSIAVYNPSTGKSLIVGTQYHFLNRNMSWFGRHPSSGEYRLVMLNSDWKFGVYKLSRSNLKLIHLSSSGTYRQFFLDSGDYLGTLLHGAVHWPTRWIYDEDDDDASRPRHSICAYHLDHNKCFEISLPVQDQGRYFKLGVVGGCLFAILKPSIDAEFEMWIMKEYGVEQPWTKYANILGFDIYTSLSPLGFLPNGDLILNVDYNLYYKYSFNDNKQVLLMNRRYGVPIMCADSLVSPTIVVAVE